MKSKKVQGILVERNSHLLIVGEHLSSYNSLMKQLSLFLISLMFLASCGQDTIDTVMPKKLPNTTHTQVNTASGVRSYTEIISGTTEKIKNTEEFQACMHQQANMCIQAVGMDIAQKTKDMSFCKEL